MTLHKVELGEADRLLSQKLFSTFELFVEKIIEVANCFDPTLIEVAYICFDEVFLQEHLPTGL
jgi:hypothetical protein